MSIDGIVHGMMVNNAFKLSGEVSKAQKQGEMFQAYLAQNSQREAEEKAEVVQTTPNIELDRLVVTDENYNRMKKRSFKKKSKKKFSLSEEGLKLDIKI